MGMVLQAAPVGDYDKRIVLLTKERGKISAFARGARKPNSTLVSCCQSFVFGTFTLYEGRQSYTVVSAQIENYFTEIQSDWNKICYASYFMEVAEYLSRENVDATDVLKLLYQSLRILIRAELPYALIRYIFELKILCYDGEMPELYQCLDCGKEVTETPYFLPEKGGIVCGKCADEKAKVILKNGTWKAMQYIVTAPVNKVFSFTVSTEVLEQLGNVVAMYMKQHIQKEFHSLYMLQN